MSMTWQEFEEDLLRREPQPKTIILVPRPKWNRWDWFMAGFFFCFIVGLIGTWIGDLS